MILETFTKLSKANIDLQWILEDLISPGGWTFLIGETGVGKSMFCIQLCEALQQGKSFLGRSTLRQNCLFIQADAGLVEWHKQVKELAGDSFAWTAHQLDRGWLDIDWERKRLHEIVWGDYSLEVQGEKNYHNLAETLMFRPFTFVIIDCLHAATNLDINTKPSMSSVLASLDSIVTRRVVKESGEKVLERVHYILIHHPNATVKKGATVGAGHKGFSDACTTKLNLLALGEDKKEGMLILEKSKIAGYKEILLERASNGAWILAQVRQEESYSDLSDSLDSALSKRRSNKHLVS